MITATLIGETTGGMTAIEIHDSETLVYSHRWFADGASTSGYIRGLCEAVDCMKRCADWQQFDGREVDEDGEVVAMDTERTTGGVLSYSAETGWVVPEDFRNYGQSVEIVDALMSAGIIAADEDHDGGDNEVVRAIVEHLSE